MLTELAVSHLGVIADLHIVLGTGLTALTGETGAGKTLMVEAISLLVGGRSDVTVVAPGAEEATVEGRFVIDDEEVVLARAVPRQGRSRAYVNGRLAPVAALADWGERLVDLHGQHAHQSLLRTAAQRGALDRFGGVDLGPLRDARAELARIDAELAHLGGDDRARAREIDLLRYQLAELGAAELDDADEEARLEAEEDRLGDASAHREAADVASALLSADGPAADALAQALGAVSGRGPFADSETRLRGLAAELADVAADIRSTGELIEDSPERLAAVTERRQRLRDLRRKYGETLADVIGYDKEARDRLAALESRDEQATALDRARVEAARRLAEAEATVAAARRNAAPALAVAVERHLADLAMAKANVSVEAGGTAGQDVTLLLAASSGSPLLPLTRVASGGELARVMLAVRLVLAGVGPDEDTGPPTLVFDEVDSGIGGQAAVAVGRALAALAARRQVLVVTHLPQVAAYADVQIAVHRDDDGRTTTARATVVGGDDRVVELSRMLSGSPGSATAREHAAELLATAARTRQAVR